jgi:hypothetical protein
MPRTGSQTLGLTGPTEDSNDSDELFNAEGEGLRPMLGVWMMGETEDCYVHIDGIHGTNEFERIPAYTPVERIVMNPVNKTGSITRILGYSATGSGALTWAPTMEWVN